MQPSDAEGPPKNVVVVVLDDLGFGQLGCYGGTASTPHLDGLAASGVALTSFHTTALCTPTRSALLTGRNSHRNGMGSVPLRATDDEGYNARTPKSHGYLSEVLRQEGYSTIAVGKWHLTPYSDMSPAGPFNQWPLGRGFDRFYGFLHAETDQWHPRLVEDNGFVDPPDTPGYHLSEDLADVAIRRIQDVRSAAPSKPYFLYFCPGATHAPLHAPAEDIAAYRGSYDHGWHEEAVRILRRQKELGVIGPEIELPAWPDGIPNWETLTPDEKRVAARLQEVFAGFVTHIDAQIGRVLDTIEAMRETENTMVVLISDNGASGEGGRLGTINELRRLNRFAERDEDTLTAIDELGGPGTYPHYPTGWALAGNTPFRQVKKHVHEGGIADPCIVRVPWLEVAGGTRRNQYHHVTDIMPTILECLDIEPPATVDSVDQATLDGGSFAYALSDPAAPRRKTLQYFESMGQRALWKDGWKVVASHIPQSGVGNFTQDEWELYDTDRDPTESIDLAAAEPDRLRELVAEWFVQADINHVLPLDDSKTRDPLFSTPTTGHDSIRFYRGGSGVQQWTSLSMRQQSFRLSATIDIRPESSGPVFAHGGRLGGLGLYTDGVTVGFAYNVLDLDRHVVTLDAPQRGRADVVVEFTVLEEGQAVVVLRVGEAAERMHIPAIVPLRFDAEGATYVGRDPFHVFAGLCEPSPRDDVAHVDLGIVGRDRGNPAHEKRAALSEQ